MLYFLDVALEFVYLLICFLFEKEILLLYSSLKVASSCLLWFWWLLFEILLFFHYLEMLDISAEAVIILWIRVKV